MGSQVLKKTKMDFNLLGFCAFHRYVHTRCTFNFRKMIASATVSEVRGLASRISTSLVSSDAERSE